MCVSSQDVGLDVWHIVMSDILVILVELQLLNITVEFQRFRKVQRVKL